MNLLIASLSSLAVLSNSATELKPVVELFTSQSCSSCPPAEENLRRLSVREDVVAIEWHVDYWNDLHVGRAGRWKDPFSSPEYTLRQRDYNASIRGTRAVYTPQAVINGRTEAVGSRPTEINNLIHSTAFDPDAVKINRSEGGAKLDIANQSSQPIEISVVSLRRAETTRIGGGENSGLTLEEAHIAKDVRIYTIASGGTKQVSLGEDYQKRGCAILVGTPNSDQLMGGAYC